MTMGASESLRPFYFWCEVNAQTCTMPPRVAARSSGSEGRFSEQNQGNRFFSSFFNVGIVAAVTRLHL
jgi:hypothetical protein